MSSEEVKENGRLATTSEAGLDSLQLIAALLYCFPELAKVKLDVETNSVIIGFCVNTDPSEELLLQTKKTVVDGLTVYHILDKDGDWNFDFYYHELVVYIVRDIASLSRQEINLIVTLVRESLAKVLVADDNTDADEEVILTQADMIDRRLVFLRENKVRQNMQGVREDGRVMVFDH